MKSFAFLLVLIPFTLFGQDSAQISDRHTRGSVEFFPTFIKGVEPKYPEMAKKAQVQGSVVFDATITEQGVVKNVVLVTKRANPHLVAEAEAALVQRIYKPLRLDGKAVSAPIRVEFRLNKKPCTIVGTGLVV